jgi:hypothetical protein
VGAAARHDPSIRYFVLDTLLDPPLQSGQIDRRTRGDREGGDRMAKKKAAKKKKKK